MSENEENQQLPATEGQIQDIWDHLNNTLWPHINDLIWTDISNLKKENEELKQSINELNQAVQALADQSLFKNKVQTLVNNSELSTRIPSVEV